MIALSGLFIQAFTSLEKDVERKCYSRSDGEECPLPWPLTCPEAKKAPDNGNGNGEKNARKK